MRTTPLIKVFEFPESERASMQFGPGCRLNAATHRVQLEADDFGAFPVGTFEECRSRLFRPSSAARWTGFQASSVNKVDAEGDVCTRVGYRLAGAGADSFWWDGAAWAATTDEWNTEEEVSSHVGDFPVQDGVRVVMGLWTSDDKATPEVSQLKLSWDTTADFLEELVLRSLVPTIRAGLRPRGDVLIDLAEDTDSVGIGGIETGYHIVGIDSAFNETDDPEHYQDIFVAWSPPTTVVLAEELAAGKRVRVRFVYEPIVAVMTSQDYDEVAGYPAVLVEDVSLADAYSRGAGEDIVNKGPASGLVLLPPVQGDLDFRLTSISDKLVDHLRLSEEIERLVAAEPMVRSPAFDEEWPLTVAERYTSRLVASKGELHTGSCRLRLRNVALHLGGARQHPAATRFTSRGSLNFSTHEGD